MGVPGRCGGGEVGGDETRAGRCRAAGGPLCVSERVDERRRTYLKSSSVYPETPGAPVMEQEMATAMLTLQEIRRKEMETR